MTRNTRFNSLPAFIFCLGLGLMTNTAIGADQWIEPGTEKVKFGVGVFLPSFSTDVRVNVDKVGGSGVSLEDDLGLSDSNTTGYAFARWRIAPRHRLSAGYFSFQRDAGTIAETDLEIGDGSTISAGAAVETDFNLRIIPVAYSYSIVKQPQHELALSAGLHWGSADLDIGASAWVEDADLDGKVEAKGDFPLPLFGISYDYWINDRWTIRAAGEYFQLSFDKYDGRAYNLTLATEYWIWNNVGTGIGVNAFGVDIDVDDSDWKGSLEYRYWGPQLYLMARF